MRLLDLGCGRGQGTFEIKKKCGKEYEVFGIDIEKENIKKAKEKYGHECNFISAKGEKIPFDANYFDLIHSIEVLEHVNDLNKTISEVARVLKKGGIFIATFPNAKSEKELVKLNKDYLKQIGHRRIINLDKFKKLIKKNFEIKKSGKYNSVEHIYWKFLFKKDYKITSENGDLDRPAPRLLTLFENLFNPDKKYFGDKKKHKIIKKLNKVFSKTSFLFDLFFIKKRIKIIAVKK